MVQSDLDTETDFSFGAKVKLASVYHKKVVEIPILRAGLDLGYASKDVSSAYIYPNINLIFPNGRWSLEGGYKLYTNASYTPDPGVISVALYGLFGL